MPPRRYPCNKALEGLRLSEVARLKWLRSIVTWRAEVGAEYRKQKILLRTQLSSRRTHGASTLSEPWLAELNAARTALAPSGERLNDLARRFELSQPLANLVGSIVHMHCNRLIGIDRSAESRVLGLLLRTSEGLEESARSLKIT
jgi:lantibiotic biosynthesis protein